MISETKSGMIWSMIERFACQAVSFVIQLVLARLLLPQDYGLIGIVLIFINIAQTFTDGGFTNSLIQRKKVTATDFSTAFYFNIVTGFILSAVLFLLASPISHYYNKPELQLIMEISSINLFILSFQTVQKAKLTINLDFKRQTFASLPSVIVSGVIGIVMAYRGFGVWSLVAQFTLQNFIQTVLLWCLMKYKPLWCFSIQSFKTLFSFGSKVLTASLLHTLYLELFKFVIGKRFSVSELGLYTKANEYSTLPSSNINNIIQRVNFPVMSRIQDDNIALQGVYRQYIRLMSFIVFPLMLGLAASGESVIWLLLGKNWLGVIPLLQILSIYYMFYPLNAISVNLMQVKGRSSLFLRLELVKKVIGIGLLFAFLPFGLRWVCVSLIVYALINLIINFIFVKRLIGLTFGRQTVDILKIFLLSALMFCGVYAFNFVEMSYFVRLSVQICSGVVIYFALSYLFRVKELSECIKIIFKR